MQEEKKQDNLNIENPETTAGCAADKETAYIDDGEETAGAEAVPEAETKAETAGIGRDGNQDDGRKGKSSCRRKSELAHWIVEGVLTAAAIALFVLHFAAKDDPQTAMPAAAAEPGTGEIVFVNMDTIQEDYEMVSQLINGIDAEKQKQEAVFQERQKKLEGKLATFQQNYQSGQLTPKQVEYAQMTLQEESQKLQSDYERTLGDLEARYTAAVQQVADSLKSACRRVNARRNASFIFSYQTAGPLIYADPTKDMTQAVVQELNNSYQKGNKK